MGEGRIEIETKRRRESRGHTVDKVNLISMGGEIGMREIGGAYKKYWGKEKGRSGDRQIVISVSYTHLTLPTIA